MTVLDLIGNTPLIPIRKLNPYKNVQILAKLEGFNPGGSVKDRVALSMIERAEKRGELTKDKIVLEASSGNTGIGLAMVCAVKGYRCLIAMSEAASIERRKIMQAFGAEIMLTPARLSTDGAIEAVYELYRKEPEKYFCTDQFNNPDNWKAHYYGTAMEIWEQTQGKVDCICATMGTTGTLMGIAKRMRELNPKVRIVGGEPNYGHRIQGLKNMKESYKPGIYDKSIADRIRTVNDDEAFELARELARVEGIFVGMSSGAALSLALKEASEMKSGTIVVIFPDGGERYLSTSLFQVPGEFETEKSGVLRFYNSLTRKKEPFEPISKGKVGIYSCGPTAYEHAHLGLCRRMVVADLLRRVLEHIGYKVTHVMNITDIDDKTVNGALKSGQNLKDFTEKYIKSFLEDAKTLNIKIPTHLPKASEHINEMIDISKRLIDSGMAYEKHSSVYFDISKLPSYGALTHIDTDKVIVGRTVDLDEYDKDSPLDFTLLKRISLQELKAGIGFESPWGKIRPGWHIECVAMSMKYLGEFFDIHTSGTDLMFPHHENEIAISKALNGTSLAKTWLHSELVFVDGKKMSRSAGNVVTLKDLIKKGYTGRQVRFFLLRSYYKSPIQFSFSYLEEAIRALKRLDNFTGDLISLTMERKLEDNEQIPASEQENNFIEIIKKYEHTFWEGINDDLNTPKAIGSIFQLARYFNPIILKGEISTPCLERLLSVLKEFDSVLSILNLKFPDHDDVIKVRELIQMREQARSKNDWIKADAIRDELAQMGIEILDTPHGVRWRMVTD
ncbi:Cysteinyl-tRNA synthetase [Dissulfuribacter thermophilus]|uniref:Cysteine--tRNA ligase n=1 Tax=Dissulfuribacter thermophilus TaxID=1156395 RepID=A0A1B9F4Q9_9BACT|nr:cysteine--tRNA ligase [Dissulfuribacter thermophilus]OCC14918.1 Cysteinyl-tRNA synthetase [Dissulfuribacter thermophilus]